MAKTPNRVIRVPDRTWDAYGHVCEAEGVKRTADLIAFMERRINAFIRKGGVLPPAEAAETAKQDEGSDA
ncbi:hypothetical protein [Micromonospora sediminicola]|uniref:hypothetical protein n=1 Tax=Micromonospora sediminicola TaxID=946078 RepID=UPI0037BCA1E9